MNDRDVLFVVSPDKYFTLEETVKEVGISIANTVRSLFVVFMTEIGNETYQGEEQGFHDKPF